MTTIYHYDCENCGNPVASDDDNHQCSFPEPELDSWNWGSADEDRDFYQYTIPENLYRGKGMW